MKALEQLVIRARTRWRSRKAASGEAETPARLLLRLDDLDAPVPPAGELQSLARWFDAVIRVVEATGPLPVRIVARADHGFLPELARFCHRLECPVSVRTTPGGLDARRAEDLVDAGVGRVALRAEDGLAGAIAALRAAVGDRGARMDVEVEVPPGPWMRDAFGEARSAGADGVRVVAWQGGPWEDATRAALAWAKAQHAPFHRTPPEALAAIADMAGDGPGVPRRAGACPVAQRIEIGPDGRASCCPFLSGSAPPQDTLEATWAMLAGHRTAIRACRRACVHPEVTG
ncbi:MAG: hypothetical protein ACOZNI_04215 [Myxococcota bacterium]